MLISTQLPIGTTALLERQRNDVNFVCAPEYFRRGQMSHGFCDPSIIVLGVRAYIERARIISLYPESLQERMLWMSPESAEMSKHAINSFLATSITFANEMARLCACAGAQYADVERVLRHDQRIGERAYVASGKADGTHLLRDLRYLREHVGGYQSQLIDLIIDSWQFPE